MSNDPTSRLLLNQPGPAANGAALLLLLRPRDAARALAISERLLWQLTKDGDLPCVRVGRAVRYDPRDLREWIERRRSTHGEK